MNPGLEISVVWADEHLIELLIKAANTQFGGEIRSYAAVSEFREIAKAIEGFPASPLDSREYTVGSPDSSVDGGMAKLVFRCLDSVGHVAVNVELRDYPQTKQALITNHAEFGLETNPGDIDAFIRQLLAMTNEVGKTASLRAF